MKSLVDRAKAFAKKAHAKGLPSPKFKNLYHPKRVVHELIVAGVKQQELLAAAWVHDTIEERVAWYTELMAQLSRHTADIVYAITNELGHGRIEVNHNTWPKYENFPDALALKLADYIANTEFARKHKTGRDRIYQAEYSSFRDRMFSSSHAYSSPVMEKLWTKLDKLLAHTLY